MSLDNGILSGFSGHKTDAQKKKEEEELEALRSVYGDNLPSRGLAIADGLVDGLSSLYRVPAEFGIRMLDSPKEVEERRIAKYVDSVDNGVSNLAGLVNPDWKEKVDNSIKEYPETNYYSQFLTPGVGAAGGIMKAASHVSKMPKIIAGAPQSYRYLKRSNDLGPKVKATGTLPKVIKNAAGEGLTSAGWVGTGVGLGEWGEQGFGAMYDREDEFRNDPNLGNITNTVDTSVSAEDTKKLIAASAAKKKLEEEAEADLAYDLAKEIEEKEELKRKQATLGALLSGG